MIKISEGQGQILAVLQILSIPKKRSAHQERLFGNAHEDNYKEDLKLLLLHHMFLIYTIASRVILCPKLWKYPKMHH